MEKRILTNEECQSAAEALAAHYVRFDMPGAGNSLSAKGLLIVYGVPRGGIPVAYLTCWTVTDKPEEANLFVDDIIDSGKTRDRYKLAFPKTPFLALADFIPNRVQGQWLVFPWELGESGVDTSADDICIRLLEYIGEDSKREGLAETPRRFLKAWKEWTSGYGKDPSAVMKTFADGAEGYDEMVWMRDIPFYSHCEHHLAPFFGTATIAYIPNKSVIGASKLIRVLEIFSKRLQVQERITTQVAEALETVLQPKGVGVILKARHLCMESRGVHRQGQEMVTSALKGALFADARAREEFLIMAR